MKHLRSHTEEDYYQLLKSIGKLFREYRLKKNEKILSVAITIGYTHPVVSKIENGTYYSLNISIIIKLLRYYDVSITQFFNEIEKCKLA